MRRMVWFAAAAAFAQYVSASPVSAGEATEPRVVISPQTPGGTPPATSGEDQAKKYEGNEEAIATGKQLYSAMNCNGCHAGGGGGMGPALTDDKWLFGSSVPNIVATINEGRANGMPAWRGKIPQEQIWQLAAYVKWLSQNGPPPPL